MVFKAKCWIWTILLVTLVISVSCQRRPEKRVRVQGRTLGLISPLLQIGLSTLAGPYDVPEPITTPGSAGSQSDAINANYGNVAYPNYGGYGSYSGFPFGYPGYGNYRPNVNIGAYYARPPSYRPLGYPGFSYGYPNYLGLGGYRPSYSGYQRPSYGNYARPTGLGNIGTFPISVASTTSTNPGGSISTASTSTGGSQLSTAQAAQLAGLLGQALGSSLRPLVSNSAGVAAAGGGSGNASALNGLLGLFGG